MKPRSGFTLAEVIIVCGILSVVIIMVTNLLPSAVFLLRGSEHRLQASRMCHRCMEEARSTPLQELRLQPLVQSQDGIFKMERKVTAVTGVAPDKLAEVRVQVIWTEFQRTGTLEMLTYVSSLSR